MRRLRSSVLCLPGESRHTVELTASIYLVHLLVHCLALLLISRLYLSATTSVRMFIARSEYGAASRSGSINQALTEA